VTFVETDVDDRIKQLQRAGIEPKSVVRGEQVSLAIITDLDGNQVVFAQGEGEKDRTVNGEAAAPEEGRCVQSGEIAVSACLDRTILLSQPLSVSFTGRLSSQPTWP
jgi:hypothetical protein